MWRRYTRLHKKKKKKTAAGISSRITRAIFIILCLCGKFCSKDVFFYKLSTSTCGELIYIYGLHRVFLYGYIIIKRYDYSDVLIILLYCISIHFSFRVTQDVISRVTRKYCSSPIVLSHLWLSVPHI